MRELEMNKDGKVRLLRSTGKKGKKRNSLGLFVGHRKYVVKGFATRQTTNSSLTSFHCAEKGEGYLYRSIYE